MSFIYNTNNKPKTYPWIKQTQLSKRLTKTSERKKKKDKILKLEINLLKKLTITWPAIILTIKRNPRVKGRIKKPISSKGTKKKTNNKGLEKGVKWIKKFFKLKDKTFNLRIKKKKKEIQKENLIILVRL